MRIIAISGKIGVGKSTVADCLLEMIPGAVRLAFADPLKHEVSRLYHVPLELCYSQAGKQSIVFIGQEGLDLLGAHTMQLRLVLQKHGMMRRQQSPGYWDDKMLSALQGLRSDGCPAVIIDDARFPSEVALIRQLQGDLYRIEPYPGWTPGAHALHESETALDNWSEWDACFYPEKGMEQLQAVAKCICNHDSEL